MPGHDPTCPHCEGLITNGICGDCHAWTDSYGLLHLNGCSGGFHQDCENPDEDDEADE